MDDFTKMMFEQVGSVFSSGTLNIMIIMGITCITQLLKQVKKITQYIMAVPFVLAGGLLCFHIFVLKSPADVWMIIFFGYSGGAVFLYYVLKKLFPNFFKSNHGLKEETKKDRRKIK